MKLKSLVAALTIFALSACAPGAEDGGKADVPITGEVNIYSSRHYDTDLALYDDFTAKTGIKVNRIEAGADALIERIKSEGEFSPGDLLITVDAGRLWRAEEEGLLVPVESEVLTERLPDYLRHPEGLWFGLSKRARVIIYNNEKGRPDNLNSYADLANSVHKGKICIRSSSNIYNISLLSALIAHDGAEAAEQWAKGVVANFARAPQGNDTSQISSVAAGECDIAVVNSYYLARMAGDDEAKAEYEAVGIIFPDQEGRGTHVNISGAGLLKHAPNKENAIRFLEYLTEESAQRYFANGNNEYPAVASVKSASVVEALGEFKEDEINASELGSNQTEAVKVFDRVGWQ
ncbi:Fe(3+) ABC transporter substrate-binding protein [Parasphingorhabdus litoris]|uniref:Fe(3+) ABC transporter substrate-binding protein n=1 Tax=Parasphingorhabdus litoris TaxID=394733 RepID=A0ABN1ALD3_9SPHN|nr:Fe(3+) ABC transporter substrate-binding protein [Parasphingorhabdus litoris]